MKWSAVDECIQDLSMLKHPFYQAWSHGQLTLDDLRFYAGQYYTLENNFPRFLSRVHSNCEDAAARQKILENLIDEEWGPENHRELWLRFAEGLGLDRAQALEAKPTPETRACVETFMRLASQDYATGLTALYAYESQLPGIAPVKVDGLRRFYGFENPGATRFFAVHEEADRWHSAEEKRLILASGAGLEGTLAASRKACRALLGFLDGVDRSTRLTRPDAAC